PPQVKAGLALLISLLIWPAVNTEAGIVLSPLALTLGAMREILLAAALAFLAQLIVAAAQFAGQLMSFQMGMTVANVFDPSTQSQQSVISQLAMTLAMLLWLASGTHHLFLQALFESFHRFPVGAAWSIQAWPDLLDAAAAMFALALKLAAPVMLLLTFLYIALGLLARAVPQIQVFFVSFPLTTGLGLLALGLGMPAIIALMHDAFVHLGGRLPLFLRHLAG
ncbi:MAG: flagellar biosynthetic protein FliR, partial [Mariprofundaceae bacterium]